MLELGGNSLGRTHAGSLTSFPCVPVPLLKEFTLLADMTESVTDLLGGGDALLPSAFDFHGSRGKAVVWSRRPWRQQTEAGKQPK